MKKKREEKGVGDKSPDHANYLSLFILRFHYLITFFFTSPSI